MLFKQLGDLVVPGPAFTKRNFITATVFSDSVGTKLGIFSEARDQACTVVLIDIGISGPQRSHERVEKE